MLCVNIDKGSLRVLGTGVIGRSKKATWSASAYRVAVEYAFKHN